MQAPLQSNAFQQRIALPARLIAFGRLALDVSFIAVVRTSICLKDAYFEKLNVVACCERAHPRKCPSFGLSMRWNGGIEFEVIQSTIETCVFLI